MIKKCQNFCGDTFIRKSELILLRPAGEEFMNVLTGVVNGWKLIERGGKRVETN